MPAFNPYLPSWEYIPDGEPRLFNGRVYVYGSHDLFNGAAFCMGDYVGWSAAEDDLSAWRCEGVIYRREQDPVQKYRKGYLLFLLRLDRTAFPHLPSDTTTVHGKKGELAFRRNDIEKMVGEYNAVRYGGAIPDEYQLSAQERLLNELY